MVSQQTETKTTTVLVEVHHSEEDSVSNSQVSWYTHVFKFKICDTWMNNSVSMKYMNI